MPELLCPTCRRTAAHIVDGRCTACQLEEKKQKKQGRAAKKKTMTEKEEQDWALREFCAGRGRVRRP